MGISLMINALVRPKETPRIIRIPPTRMLLLITTGTSSRILMSRYTPASMMST